MTGSGRTMIRGLVSVALALALGVASGCGRVGAVQVPTEPAGITGRITSIRRADGQTVWGTVMVEGGAQPQGALSDKAQVAITEETLIAQGGRWIPADALKVGMSVRVWFAGAVAESYPVQGSARFIEVR